VRSGNPVVAAVVGSLWLAGLAWAQTGTDPGDLEIYDAIPVETTLHLRVGDRRQFSIWVRGENLNYQWQVDGGPVGDRHAWAFTPRLTDIGFHLVTVVVDGGGGRVTHTWRVTVDVPEPGEAEPVPPTTSVPPPPVPPPSAPPPVAPPATPTTAAPRPTTSSSERPTTTSTSSTTPSTREPTTTSTRPPSTTTTTRRTTTTTQRPTTTTTVRPTTTSSVVPTTSTTRVPTTIARAGTISENEVRALFERYKAAWRNHDIDALESVGQIATQGQADALKSYFASVEDLEVDVTILAITISGDEAHVRFIRRDHFRDPGGSMVTKESPVIEKRVVRTPGGLRLAAPR
jgi:hypothetical protein